MQVQQHIELLKKIRMRNKRAYTMLILQFAKEHLTESGFIINPNDNDIRLTINEFTKEICPKE